MAGVCSGGCLFQTVAHEFPIGGAALHAGLGLLVLPLPRAILHFFLFRRNGFGRSPLGQPFFQPGKTGGSQGANEAGRKRGGGTPLHNGRPPLSSYRSRVERHDGTPNTIGPTKISYASARRPPDESSGQSIRRLADISASVGRGLAERT